MCLGENREYRKKDFKSSIEILQNKKKKFMLKIAYFVLGGNNITELKVFIKRKLLSMKDREILN